MKQFYVTSSIIQDDMHVQYMWGISYKIMKRIRKKKNSENNIIVLPSSNQHKPSLAEVVF